MVEFDPSFEFEFCNNIVSTLLEVELPERVPSSRSVDLLIAKYRAEYCAEIIPFDAVDIEVEEIGTEQQCKIKDTIKLKPCKYQKKIEDEDEHYNFLTSLTKYTVVDSFIDFKFSKPILKALTESKLFKPTPIQCACIPVALLNRDICACAQTGSGKTLAFLLPVLERIVYTPHSNKSSTKVLIISPTRELAVQIFKITEQLVKYCPALKVQLAAGGLDLLSQEASLRSNPDIVVATPGRLIDHLANAPNFSLHTIEYLILDEADKLLDEHFTEQIGEIIRHCNQQRQTLLFSATMTESVKELATVSLKNPVRIFLSQYSAVANQLQQEFVRIRPQREGDRDSILAALLARSFQKQVIVFFPTKKDCHRMHILLGLMGFKCAELHGDMSQAQRLEALRGFTEAVIAQVVNAESTSQDHSIDILLATDLASRGLDIPNVKTVINYRLPHNIKQYVHRVGRTARAANVGRAISLAGESDRKLLKEVIRNAPFPVKARAVPQDVIARFKSRIDKIIPYMKEILQTEEEDRELKAAEEQMARTERLLTERRKDGHAQLPKRANWFTEKRAAEFVKQNAHGKSLYSSNAKRHKKER